MAPDISRYPKDFGRPRRLSKTEDDLEIEAILSRESEDSSKIEPDNEPEDITEIPVEGTMEERSAKQIFADDIARDVVNLQNALVPKEDVPDKIRAVHAKITGVIWELESSLQQYEMHLENQKVSGRHPKERQEIEKKIRNIAKEIKYWKSQAEAVEALNTETIYTLKEILERLPGLDPKTKELVFMNTELQKDFAKIHMNDYDASRPDRQIEIMKGAVNVRLLAEMKVLKGAGITVDEQGEPVVGLWGKLTNKAGKIKKTEFYQFYKALFDFGKNLQGLTLPEKKAAVPRRTRNTVKQSDFQTAVGVTAGVGAAIAMGHAAMNNEDTRPEPLTDEIVDIRNSKPAAKIAAEVPEPKIAKRGEEETVRGQRGGIELDQETVRMAKKGVENAKPRGEKLSARDKALADAAAMMESVDRASGTVVKLGERILGTPSASEPYNKKPKTDQEIARIERAKDAARAAAERARAIAAARKGVLLKAKTESKTETVAVKKPIIGPAKKGPEMPVRLENNTATPFEDADIDLDEQEENGDTSAELSNKLLQETMRKANSGVKKEEKLEPEEFIPESAKLKMNMGMKGPEFERALGSPELADLWRGKLEIAIDDILRNTPKEDRIELVQKLNSVLTKKTTGKSDLRLIADFARDMRLAAIKSGSKEAQRIAEGLQNALFANFDYRV